MVPISTVEKPGFIKMVTKLDPRYTLPSRHHFAREALPAMYNDVKDRLISQLAKVTTYALTTDMWSSRRCEPYMCITVYYIAEDWEVRSACLQTSYFPQDHTGEHIAEALQETVSSWGLKPSGLVAVTTDNGSNVVKAIELAEWRRMQCFGHRLHLAFGCVSGHAMDDPRITRAISICKKVVSGFSYSWKRGRGLGEAQQQLGLASHQLITESATRWGFPKCHLQTRNPDLLFLPGKMWTSWSQ